MKSGRPRDAASLIAFRRDRSGWRVLMGRRSTRTRFMPEVWVFPGGRVDRDDHSRDVASTLRPSVARRIGTHDPQALAVAALRETWEETGVAIGHIKGDSIFPDLGRIDYVGRAITPAGQPLRYHARFFCMEWTGRLPRLRSNGELEELAWWSIDEVLALPTVDVTDLMLEEALARVESSSGARRPALFVHYRGQRPYVRRER